MNFILVLLNGNLYFVDHHHKHNSKLFSASIGSYPIATKQKYFQMSRSERFKYLATRHPLTIALGYFTMFIFGMCIASFISNPKKHWDSLVALILHASASVLIFIFLGWETWLFLFFLPFLIAFATGSYLFYAQHNFPGVQFAGTNDWAYERAAMESSSFMEMPALMSWLMGNIGYHHIHHLNARIPFYRLPEAMRGIPELQSCKRTSLSPRDIIACLKLKVWDREAGCMIGFRKIRGLEKTKVSRFEY
jgi:omega-6 fatty acid desaturase (delta-12 desaturase)